MKYLLLLCLLLVGCTTAQETTSSWDIPKGLKDCKVYTVSSTLNTLYVMRCPNSQTTTKKGGKYPKTTTVVEE